MPNNAHPVDYTMRAPTFNVEVLKDDILKSIRCIADKCMLHNAIIRAYRKRYGVEPLYVRVDATRMQFSCPITDRIYIYHHTLKTYDAFMRWDRGESVKPFSFQLRDGQARKRGWRATHKPGWKPKKNRSSRGKGNPNRVPKMLRQFGACIFSRPTAALKARHKKAA